MFVSRSRRTTGQASVEFALVLVFGVVPLTFGLIALVEVAWTYHALTTLTRLGAQYAATHCFADPTGQNVVTWLTDSTNASTPAFPDRPQLATGGIQIAVQYSTNDLAGGISTTPPTCSPDCSTDCVPDSVTVSIAAGDPTAYTFNRFLISLGLPTVSVPAFATTLPMENGVNSATTP